ncbi:MULTISPECIES: hypothetical protein, partial [Enterobacteriaceae]|uniref:hypothetical protein n=1 Tax=Enterobacteriaceae TaxID=543 RepID=UPI001BAB12C0
PAAERLWWLGTIPSRCVYNRSELTYYQVFFPPFFKKNTIKYRQLHPCDARQGMEGAKENTREQRGHIAPKRGAAADEHTRMHRAIPSPCKARTDQQAMIMLICAAECRS